MGTFTAQILIGQKHTYESGIINITHTLYLTENGRSAWILSPWDEFSTNKENQIKITWIPTLENMLEDAMVMIGLYVLKDKELIALANQYFQRQYTDNMILYSDITPEGLQELYEQARSIESSHKIILSVFQGSSIRNQLPVLKYYKNDIEVCKSIFIKEFSPWSREFEEHGELS